MGFCFFKLCTPKNTAVFYQAVVQMLFLSSNACVAKIIHLFFQCSALSVAMSRRAAKSLAATMAVG
jgi:hypothetical protein